ncbi:MAG: glycosyltransferase family 39 protein [Acidimicrobiales bacterium]
MVAPLVVGAIVVRVLYLVVIVSGRPPASDADQYLDIARHVRAGEGFVMQWPQLRVHATAFRPPAYPALLGAWMRVFGESVTAARCLNLVLGVVVVVATFALVRRLRGDRAGLVAGGLVCVYPPLLANDATTLAEPLALVLLLAVVWAAMDRRWWLAGVTAGLLTLTKPSAQGFVAMLVVLAFVLAFRERSGGPWIRRALVASATVLATAAVVVVPWIVRNQVELGTTSVVTSNGFNLMAIYGDVARERGTFVDIVGDPAYQSMHFRLLRLDEGQWNDELTRRALSQIREHPGYVASTVGNNLRYWFELSPGRNDIPESQDGRDVDFRHLTLPLFYPVTVLGLAGLGVALARPGRPGRPGARLAVLLLVLSALYATATSLVLVAPPRLRAPFDLACCIGVGLLVAELPGTGQGCRRGLPLR